MSAVIKPTPPQIRPMEIMDIKQVIKVERAAYEFPRSEEHTSELQSH